jgi:hypothetical protein
MRTDRVTRLQAFINVNPASVHVTTTAAFHRE